MNKIKTIQSIVVLLKRILLRFEVRVVFKNASKNFLYLENSKKKYFQYAIRKWGILIILRFLEIKNNSWLTMGFPVMKYMFLLNFSFLFLNSIKCLGILWFYQNWFFEIAIFFYLNFFICFVFIPSLFVVFFFKL